jgi:adenylate kinase family enzyme
LSRKLVKDSLSRKTCQGKLVKENLSRKTCEGKHVKDSLSRKTCQGKLVRENMSRTACQGKLVKENLQSSVWVRPVYTCNFCCGFRCDFLLLMDVNELLTSDEGTYTSQIH